MSTRLWRAGTRCGELVSRLDCLFRFAICFAWGFERRPLGSNGEVLYPWMHSVMKIVEDPSML